MKNIRQDNREIKIKQDAWDWFGLSYASWLVVPRIALQSMPDKWQNKFFDLLDELYERVEFPDGYNDLTFVVTAKKDNKFTPHILPHYKHNELKIKTKSL